DSAIIEVDSDKTDIFDILQGANMDGVSHLKEKDSSRYIWCCIIVVFVLLAFVQIYYQLKLFYSEPVATNIEADYPSTIDFPAVAICNNNQFRLTLSACIHKSFLILQIGFSEKHLNISDEEAITWFI
ncbi:hypothetical protein GCK32_006498, partial [Trichostrongylus colubriformis]